MVFSRGLRVALCGAAAFLACSEEPPGAGPKREEKNPDGTVKVECGTATTKACEGTSCKDGGECESKKCEAGKCTRPLPASATDGKKNNDETDIDCGGKNAEKCADDKACKVDGDCKNDLCKSDKCAAPSATDGRKNGDETDIDCGGSSTSAPKCAAGKGCAVDGDCTTDGCDETKKCALARSCVPINGGLTCGEGEVGAPEAKHESCCTALPIPGSQTKLDKYEITAGRMRAFIERTQGDVRGWYDANEGTLGEAAKASIEPFKESLPKNEDQAIEHVAAHVFLADRPSTAQGCYVGNQGDQAFGAHTYWTGATEGEDRAYDQADLDRRSLNCVTYPIVAAFCAWDGGRLQTWEENSAAYGAGKYPWGETPEAGGQNNFPFPDGPYQNIGPGAFPTPPTPAQPVGPCAEPTCQQGLFNWSNSYQVPVTGAKPWDLANFVAPPGRFEMDKGPGGHMDLGANNMEWTSSPGQQFGADPASDPQYGPKRRWARSGSWEGHSANHQTWQFAVMTKYGKTGGRCARD
ncbi:MAG: hypothetical protein KIT84_42350 [Labilithrix sp.]|nr:hypothetical protein [Labilithrix sp.]MCW5817718.1 hypothetical protein [Labilithrix sp.]